MTYKENLFLKHIGILKCGECGYVNATINREAMRYTDGRIELIYYCKCTKCNAITNSMNAKDYDKKLEAYNRSCDPLCIF